jgi:hypothetical protein
MNDPPDQNMGRTGAMMGDHGKVLAALAAMAVLAGCQPGGGGGLFGGSQDAAAGTNPITGDAIAATSLDAPPVEGEVPVEGAAGLPVDGEPVVSAEALDAAAAPATIVPPTARQTRIVDRDVEAPEVFDVRDSALWDGRPSLGGVWVASPDARDPERVIMRNAANGQFVIGALFRRERDNPGPSLQISSDAAEALGILAGAPTEISVTALRREETPEAAPAPAAPVLDTPEVVAGELPAAPEAEPEAGTDIAAGAAAAIAAAEPAPAPTPQGGDVRVQVGIFSVQDNGQRAVDRLTGAGIAASLREETQSGKTFWSVIATGPGPRAAFVDKVRAAGFADAYPLSG